MSGRDSRWRVVAALGLAALAGCAGNDAPSGFLSSPEEAARTAWGGWISLEIDATPAPIDTRGVPPVTRLAGELIAVGEDSVYVLDESGLSAVPVAAVLKATFTAYDARARALGYWTLAGTVSTLSHGVGLLVSAPLWLATGISATSAQSRQGRVSGTERSSWAEMRPFARFPQGLPPGFDRTALRPRLRSTGQKTRWDTAGP